MDVPFLPPPDEECWFADTSVNGRAFTRRKRHMVSADKAETAEASQWQAEAPEQAARRAAAAERVGRVQFTVPDRQVARGNDDESSRLAEAALRQRRRHRPWHFPGHDDIQENPL